MKKYKVPEECAFIFLHHPRTGGSTVSKIFKEEYNRYPGGYITIGGGHILPDTNSLSGVRLKNPELRQSEKIGFVFTGHVPFGLHELFSRKSVYFSIFREPLNKIVSEYYNNIKLKNSWCRWASKLDLKGYIENGCDGANWHIENGQVKLLAPPVKKSPYGETSRDALETAQRHIKEHIPLIGIQERFDETIVLLKRALGLKNPYYTVQHKGGNRPPLSTLPPDTVDAIYRKNELDNELYSYVIDIFDEQISEAGDDFQAEVTLFKKNNQLINSMLEEGVELYEKGSQSALSVFEEILKIYPTCSEAHSFTAAIELKKKNFLKAKRSLHNASYLDNQNGDLTWCCHELKKLLNETKPNDMSEKIFPVSFDSFMERFDSALQKKQKPKVSVLTICKNSIRSIRRCIQGIVSQDYDNFEYIIHDGQSSDGTLEIIKEFAEKYSFIKFYSEKDNDADDAFYKGLCKCSGDIITLCWADEEFLPGAISWGVEKLTFRPELAAVYGDIAASDIDGNIQNGNVHGLAARWSFHRFACWEMFPNYCASFFRASALRVSGFFDNYRRGYDCIMYDYFIIPAIFYPIEYMPTVLGKFSIHDKQLSTTPHLLKALLPQLEHSLDKLLKRLESLNSHYLTDNFSRERAMGGFRVSMLLNLALFSTVDDTRAMLIDALKYAPSSGYLLDVLFKKIRPKISQEAFAELLKIDFEKYGIKPIDLLRASSRTCADYLEHCLKKGEKITVFPGGCATRRVYYLWKKAFPELIRGWYDEYTKAPIHGELPLKNTSESKDDKIVILIDHDTQFFCNKAREIFGEEVTIILASSFGRLQNFLSLSNLKGDIAPLEERVSALQEAVLLDAYIKQLFMRLFEKLPEGKTLALYGAGKHTEWLMNNVLEGTGHYPSVIFDDFPAEKNFFAVPLDRPENITKHNIGIIVISNDYSHYQMYFKLKKLLKASDIEIVDPYQELPGVPFEKLHTLREINWDRITTE